LPKLVGVEPGTSGPLTPELRAAELTLEQALASACAAQPASKADTGELIRVEEVLQVASEAAKRAISLRRKRRADRSQRAARWAMGDAEAAALAGTTHRTFVDPRGVWWEVFAVYPEPRGPAATQFKGTYVQGWLCFECDGEKRRLSPIPDNWQRLTDAELTQLLERAEVASSRRSRPRKDPRPDDRGTSD
jgi:hypothetical protein